VTTTVARVGAGVRIDARAKATGALRYSADLPAEGALHAAPVRSPHPHAEIVAIDAAAARVLDGVTAVVTAADLTASLSGRRVRDMPLLARGRVRFSGEIVAVVLATTRSRAEEAAALVEVDYRALAVVVDPVAALSPGAPLVHDEAWRYAGAVVGPDGPPNMQSELVEGSVEAARRVLADAAHTVTRTYRTPAGHQGYLEPQCWTAVPAAGGGVVLQGTAKAPYRLREQVAATLGLEPETVEVEPVAVGGDFGGKGGVVDATLCAALAIWAGRPVRLALRSGDDLAATDARHSSVIEVTVGCDGGGRMLALIVDAVLDGGAYAAVKPIPSVNLHGLAEAALGYRLEAYAVRSRIAYTNRVPKGHMRAPGAPQAVFAVESAIDELGRHAGIAPAELRRRAVLGDGDTDAYGHRWPEARGREVLDAALDAPPRVAAPEGWARGAGVALYARPTAGPATTSLRLRPLGDGAFEVEVPFPETGTGSHTLVREQLAAALGTEPGQVRVRQVPTSALPYDPGVGASRVTVGLTHGVAALASAWRDGPGDSPVEVVTEPGGEAALSYCAQVAHVAVDPGTGQLRVLELVTAVDVAEILRPRSHQMQLDGGAVMGFGFACLEDLLEDEGQVWAANLAEFRLPTPEDVPVLRTVLLEGSRGVGAADVKAVGELANVPVAAAVANAVADAVGARVRRLPVTAERVYWAMQGEADT
jgi:putative selenate reductase molybdopterin-binding subunit